METGSGHWGQGLATEGARAIARHGFEKLGLNELVSFTVPTNTKSRRVMEKLGMALDPSDGLEDPRLPEGHPCGGMYCIGFGGRVGATSKF